MPRTFSRYFNMNGHIMSRAKAKLWVKLIVFAFNAQDSRSDCPGIRYALQYENRPNIKLYGLNDDDRALLARKLKWMKEVDEEKGIIWGVRCSQGKEEGTKEPVLVASLAKVGFIDRCPRCGRENMKLYWTNLYRHEVVRCSKCRKTHIRFESLTVERILSMEPGDWFHVGESPPWWVIAKPFTDIRDGKDVIVLRIEHRDKKFEALIDIHGHFFFYFADWVMIWRLPTAKIRRKNLRW